MQTRGVTGIAVHRCWPGVAKSVWRRRIVGSSDGGMTLKKQAAREWESAQVHVPHGEPSDGVRLATWRGLSRRIVMAGQDCPSRWCGTHPPQALSLHDRNCLTSCCSPVRLLSYPDAAVTPARVWPAAHLGKLLQPYRRPGHAQVASPDTSRLADTWFCAPPSILLVSPAASLFAACFELPSAASVLPILWCDKMIPATLLHRLHQTDPTQVQIDRHLAGWTRDGHPVGHLLAAAAPPGG